MIKLVHVFKELGRNLYRNPGMLLGSFLSLAFLFLLFNLFWIASESAQRFYGQLLSEMKVEAFVSETLQEDQIPELQRSIAGVSGVEALQYISREDAREQLRSLVGADLLVGYDSLNPLPRSFLLRVNPDWLRTDAMIQLEQRLNDISGVDTVFYSRRWLEKAEATRDVISDVGIVLGLFILVTAVLNTSNNIRLMTRTRAVGFRQMRLQGAGKWFLATPFLIEGFLVGGLAAAAGWLLLYHSRDRVAFTQFEIVIPSVEQIFWFCLAAAGLGLVSVLFGIRRLVK